MRTSIAFLVNIKGLEHELRVQANAGYQSNDLIRAVARELLILADDSHYFEMTDDAIYTLPDDINLSEHQACYSEVIRYKVNPSHQICFSESDLSRNNMLQLLTFADVFDCYALTKSALSFAEQHDLCEWQHPNGRIPRDHVFSVLAELFTESDFNDVNDQREYLLSTHTDRTLHSLTDVSIRNLFTAELADALQQLNDSLMYYVHAITNAQDLFN